MFQDVTEKGSLLCFLHFSSPIGGGGKWGSP